MSLRGGPQSRIAFSGYVSAFLFGMMTDGHGRVMASVLPPLTEQSRRFIAPIHAAFTRIEAADARLPRPRSTRERLEQLYDLDQAGRAAIGKLRFDDLPEAQRSFAMNAAAGEIVRHDYANEAALKALLPPHGWFSEAIYGRRATDAAWLVVQHADNNLAFMRAVFPTIERSFHRRETSGQQYAYLYDRLALHEGRPQRYGSQLECVDGTWRAQKLEEPANVDRRRLAVGLRESEAQYLKRVDTGLCG